MLIKIKVFTNSKKQGIVEKAENSFEIKVKEKPQNNLANERLVKILASYYNISENSVKLVRGRTRRNKIFKINAKKVSP